MAALPVLADLDLGNRELQNVKAQLLGADPTGFEGKFYWHTGNKEWRVYNGTSWIAIGAPAGGTLTGVGDTSEIDLTVTGGNVSGTLINGSIVLARLANIAANTVIANTTGSAGVPTATTLANFITWLALVPANIAGFDTQVRLSRLDQMAVPTASLALNNQKITGMADGSAATDGATFGQLNAILQGQTWKNPVRLMTQGNDTLSGLAARDGVTPVAGDRVLVPNQTLHQNDGIYVAAAGAWSRATDADAAAEFLNATVLVQSGTVSAGDVYTQTATIATLGTTAQVWVKTGEGNTVYTADASTIVLTGTQFGIPAGGITATQLNASVAGNGLAGGAGTALSVGTDGTTIEISADAVRLAATAAGAGLTGGGGSALAVGAGAGISVAADTVLLDTAVAVRKYAADYGNGSLTDVPITHSLGTKDVEVVIRRNSDDKMVLVPWTATSTTVVTINHDVAPTTNQYRAIVQA